MPGWSPSDMSRTVYLRGPDEVAMIRDSAQLVAMTLAHVTSHVRPGVTTVELDRLAEAFIRAHGGRPAFKGYRGFPASLCPSVNEEVVHAIPGSRELKPATSWAATWEWRRRAISRMRR